MHVRLLDSGTKFYKTREAAQAVADTLADDDWTAVVEEVDNVHGSFVIRLYDEDGEFVHNW